VGGEKYAACGAPVNRFHANGRQRGAFGPGAPSYEATTQASAARHGLIGALTLYAFDANGVASGSGPMPHTSFAGRSRLGPVGAPQ
jgi:hypothetical protein